MFILLYVVEHLFIVKHSQLYIVEKLRKTYLKLDVVYKERLNKVENSIELIVMEVYECISCKKLREGFPATLRGKCLARRNLELEMRYHKKKFESFSKKELADQHKDLLAKLRDEDDYSDGQSENDDDRMM